MTRRRKRATAVVVAVVAFLAVPFVVLTNRWMIHPRTTNPTSADVVVVLGGGHGERLDRGLALMAANVAPVMVLSTGIHWVEPPDVVKAIKDTCAQGSTLFEVVCVSALPDSTKGEAIAVADMAKKRGWHRVVVVTTDHHLTRSMRWFERCFVGELLPVSAPAPTGVSEIAHEWAGTIDQFTLDRTCSR
jgi:uncharacterized SAM-binding protein YcdF (DUF218 family)